MTARSLPLTFSLPAGGSVSALLDTPPSPQACYVFAHGAGADMQHAFMGSLAHALVDRGIATLRFQFPFMEAGTRRPDPPAVAQAAVRAAVDEAARRLPGVPLFAGARWATLHVIEGADHAFHVLARSGRTDGEVVDELADAIAAWVRALQALCAGADGRAPPAA